MAPAPLAPAGAFARGLASSSRALSAGVGDRSLAHIASEAEADTLVEVTLGSTVKERPNNRVIFD